MTKNGDYIDLNSFNDKRGTLISMEQGSEIPFEIKRVYFLTNLNSNPRGFHAHKNLKQVMICISGSCEILLDDGQNKLLRTLSSPSKGLYIDSYVWREMKNFKDNALIVVLASEIYDESDYIRDYNDFLDYGNDK